MTSTDVIKRWRSEGVVPTQQEAQDIAGLWLGDMEGDDLEETNLAGFVKDGTVDPDLPAWVESQLASLGPEPHTAEKAEQAGELQAWLAYLESQT